MKPGPSNGVKGHIIVSHITVCLYLVLEDIILSETALFLIIFMVNVEVRLLKHLVRISRKQSFCNNAVAHFNIFVRF